MAVKRLLFEQKTYLMIGSSINMKNNPPILLFAFANERQNDRRYLHALSDERRAIEISLDLAVRRGLCETKVLPNATLAEIFAIFQDERYRDRIALFHFGGHAASFELLLEKNGQENTEAYSAGLIPFLKNQKGLEMIFLNGCNTEKWALALNNAGIPLVAGTFEAIRDNVAQQLSAQFYAGLGQGMPLRRAWDEAILRIRTETGDNLRNIGKENITIDRFPWELFQRKGADRSNFWNLPDASGDPLSAIPLPASYLAMPLPSEPFRFLDRYRKSDALLFSGRGYEIRDLYDRLNSEVGSPVILLSGQSGVGKSSLLEAGLLPRIEDQFMVLYLRRDSLKGLSATLSEALHVDKQNDNICSCWEKKVQEHNKPLICIIDQVEESFTRDGSGGEQEISDFAHLLTCIFGDYSTKPQGKILLSFRKEYKMEIEDALKQHKVDYESVFLKRLSLQGIIEVVNNIVSSPRIHQKYNLGIESDLAETIASDLLTDSDTPVAPVLQIIMTKLWENKDPDLEFTLKKYLQLKEDGIFLGDFFKQQMEKLSTWEKQKGWDVESSGLALDILNSHTTDLGFANSRSMADLKNNYQHREDVLEDLVKQFKSLYLLTDVGDKVNALAHDTLAPVVQQEVKNSDKPGQKALRILVGKIANYKRNTVQTFIDEDDLALVEQGKSGMRLWMEEEPDLIRKSQNRRVKLHRQRRYAWFSLLFLGVLAVWFGYTNFQKSRIEKIISQARLEAGTDPTIAMKTLEQAIHLDPDNPSVMAALYDIWSNNEFYELIVMHPEAVKGVIFAPDSSCSLFSWTENQLYRWSSSGILQDSCSSKNITSVALSPDGSLLVVSTQRGSIEIIRANDLQDGAIQKESPFGNVYATNLAFDRYGKIIFATCPNDSTIYALEAGDLKKVKKRFKVQSDISEFSVNPYRNSILVGYENGQSEERDPNGSILQTFSEHKDQVLSFSVSPLDSSVESAGRDAQILFRNASSSTPLTLKGHDRRINDIKWVSDGKILLSVSDDYLIKSWTPNGDLVSTYRGHSGSINAVTISKDGSYFATASEDKSVRFWKTESKTIQKYGPNTGGVTGILLSKDGNSILTSSDAGLNDASESMNDQNFDFEKFRTQMDAAEPSNIFQWNAQNGILQQEWKGHSAGINALKSDKEGKTFISASDDTTAIIWTNDGHQLMALKHGHFDKILDAAIAPNGEYFATVGEDSLLVLWNKVGNIIKVIHQNDLVRSVDFSPTNQLLVTGCYDGTVRLFDFAGNEKKIFQTKTKHRVEDICFAPDGQSILVGYWGDSALLYDLDGNILATFKSSSKNKTGGQAIRSVAISHDNKLFAIGVEGGMVKVFKVLKNVPMPIYDILHFSKKAVLFISFSPDDKSLFTGCNDRMGKWWKLPDIN
jgi:WD40 repeat protein